MNWGQMLEMMCKKMNKWLFFDECPHCVIRMEGADLMSSTVWFFIGVLTGSLVATASILLTVEWLLRRKR